MKLFEKLKNLVPHKNKKPLEVVMENKYWIIAGVIVLLMIFSYPAQEADDKLPILIKGATIRAEVADTMKDKSLGLMFRKKLPINEGMLFPYGNERKHTFWMKNTLIPLDIIWINSQKEVVHIEHSVPPCKKDPCPSYSSPYKAQYVLELNGGWSIQNGLGQGDQISFSY